MLQSVVRSPRLAEDIALGAQLAKMQNRPIGPEDVARILTDAGVKYVIVGAHAANGYTGKPRATVDVDVIVQFPKKAVSALSAAYPDLTIQDTPVVTRFKDGTLEAIDVMKPAMSKLWPRLLKQSCEIKIRGISVRVPTLEGVLAAKFNAMVSPGRQLLDKQQDGVDFGRIVVANAQIDHDALAVLGELVYRGGGAEITKLVTEARAGRRLEF
jgi:predicted nucleotidyltransferase